MRWRNESRVRIKRKYPLLFGISQTGFRKAKGAVKLGDKNLTY